MHAKKPKLKKLMQKEDCKIKVILGYSEMCLKTNNKNNAGPGKTA